MLAFVLSVAEVYRNRSGKYRRRSGSRLQVQSGCALSSASNSSDGGRLPSLTLRPSIHVPDLMTRYADLLWQISSIDATGFFSNWLKSCRIPIMSAYPLNGKHSSYALHSRSSPHSLF